MLVAMYDEDVVIFNFYIPKLDHSVYQKWQRKTMQYVSQDCRTPVVCTAITKRRPRDRRIYQTRF
jgi:hypothetical protein